MPKSIQITSPSLNNDAEYNALLQQLAAFSPAKMMSTTMAMRRQERTEEKYQETQERLLRQEKDSSAKTVLGLIDDGLKDLESGDFYTTYNIGVHSNGFKFGLSVKDEDKLASFGYNKKFKKDGLEYKIGISLKSNFDDSDILNIKSEVKKWLSEKVNIFGLYKHEYYNEQEDFQFKVGVGVKL